MKLFVATAICFSISAFLFLPQLAYCDDTRFDPSIRPASAPPLPANGPAGESDFVAGDQRVDGWSDLLPTQEINGWTFFDAIGLYEPSLSDNLSRVFGEKIVYQTVKYLDVPETYNGQIWALNRYYFVPFCQINNQSCLSGASPVDGFLLAMTHAHPDGSRQDANDYFLYFKVNELGRYCKLHGGNIVAVAGWNCGPAPDWARDYNYFFSTNPPSFDIVEQVVDTYNQATGIPLQDIMGDAPSTQPDPAEVKCMMGEISC